MPTRGLLAVETMHATVQWLENLNIKRNMTSVFVNKKHVIDYQNPILFESTLTNDKIALKYTILFLLMNAGLTPVFFIAEICIK